MVYDANIPQPTDNLSVSQGQLLANFQALDSIFNFDHFTWDDPSSGGANKGLHRKITFPVVQGSDPGGVVSSVLYTKTVTNAELFFKNAASVVTQLTGLAQSIVTNGSYTLPGGLIIKWGVYTLAPGVPSTPVTFPTAFPTNVFSCAGACDTSGSPNDAQRIIGLNVAGFTGGRINSGSPLGGTYTYYYIAIGK